MIPVLSFYLSTVPSFFAHAISSLPIARTFGGSNFRKLALWSAVCAVLPDADVLAFQFGIPYESALGHRGITHSFFFAALLATILVLTVFRGSGLRRFTVWCCLFLATASHPLLDALTNGGLGVALLAPFSEERFFFSFRPIQVSPIGAGAFFTEWGLRVLKSEGIWVGLPSLAWFLMATILRKSATNAE